MWKKLKVGGGAKTWPEVCLDYNIGFHVDNLCVKEKPVLVHTQ